MFKLGDRVKIIADTDKNGKPWIGRVGVVSKIWNTGDGCDVDLVGFIATDDTTNVSVNQKGRQYYWEELEIDKQSIIKRILDAV